MSKFLIFGEEGLGCTLAYRLMIEGEDVKMCIADKDSRGHLLGIVPHVDSMKEGLNWVGRSGYVLCDDEGDVTGIRKAGYKVYGNNAVCKRLEDDRLFQLETCKELGFDISNFHPVKSLDEAIEFIKKHPDAYAIKQTGTLPKTFSFVSKEDDGSDAILQLNWMKDSEEYKLAAGKAAFILQEVVSGSEIAVSAWWCYSDWLRLDSGEIITTLNFEHKKSLDGDLGLTCGESGTIARIEPAGKLFQETLEKLTPYLLKHASDVCGCIDANCGVVEDGTPYLDR